MKPKAVDPGATSRAEAFALWMDAPNPMVTFFKTLDVTPLVRLSRRKGLKFNMLLCWCIIRVTYVTFAVKFFPVLQTVSWAYPTTWGLSTLVFTLYYFKSDWMHAFEKRERRA